MKYIEKLLEQMSLRHPSEELDQRISQIFMRNPQKLPQLFSSSRLTTLTACAACLMLGIFLGNRKQDRNDSKLTVDSGRTTQKESNRKETNELRTFPHQAVLNRHSQGALSSFNEVSTIANNRTSISESTFYLINGHPARRIRTYKTKRFRVHLEQSGEAREIEIPIQQNIMIGSHNI